MYSFDFKVYQVLQIFYAFIFKGEKTQVKWCDIISLTVLTFTKKNMFKKKKEEKKIQIKRKAWLFWTQCIRKVYRLMLISKRVFNERLHILVLFFFYLFVCKLRLWNLFIFPPRKWDPIYLQCNVIHGHMTFSGVYVCVSNAMVFMVFIEYCHQLTLSYWQ